jgi:DNA-binding LacI/PurR family transcriptional regulator
LMAGLRDGGLRVPEDVSVIGIDGLALSALAAPPLTTVQLPVSAMARAMVNEAMAPWPREPAEDHEIVFAPAGLIEGGSVAALHARVAITGRRRVVRS